jgi:predicted transcriptional regulator
MFLTSRYTAHYSRGMAELKQTSIRLDPKAIEAMQKIGRRPEVDRDWSYLVRKAMDEFIERDEREQAAKRAAKRAGDPTSK